MANFYDTLMFDEQGREYHYHHYRKRTMAKCPCCRERTHQEYVDILSPRPIMIFGPRGCPLCGWSEVPEYNLRELRTNVDGKGGVFNQFGEYTPPGGKIYNRAIGDGTVLAKAHVIAQKIGKERRELLCALRAIDDGRWSVDYDLSLSGPSISDQLERLGLIDRLVGIKAKLTAFGKLVLEKDSIITRRSSKSYHTEKVLEMDPMEEVELLVRSLSSAVSRLNIDEERKNSLIERVDSLWSEVGEVTNGVG
jgi:hypothetical protein